MALFFCGMAVVGYYFTYEAIRDSQTTFASKHSARQIPVQRDVQPAVFWYSVGLYSVVGIMGTVLCIWAARQSIVVSRVMRARQTLSGHRPQ